MSFFIHLYIVYTVLEVRVLVGSSLELYLLLFKDILQASHIEQVINSNYLQFLIALRVINTTSHLGFSDTTPKLNATICCYPASTLNSNPKSPTFNNS